MSDSLDDVERLFKKVKITEGPTAKKELLGSKRSKAKVLWEDLVAVLVKDFGANEGDLEVIKPTLIVNGGASKPSVVRLNDHVGPIKREGKARAGEWTFSSIANLYRKEYFHGFLNGTVAQSKLSNLPKGSWLARFSTQSPKCIAISMISGENSVEHWVVPFYEDENAYIFEDKEFTTFDAFLEHYKTHVMPGSDSPLLDENIAPCLEGKISIGKKIGGGNFGTVFIADWHRADGTKKSVAAKKLGAGDAPPEPVHKDEDDDEPTEEKPISLPPDIEAESNLLKNMRHENVVSFFGMVFINEVSFIITEIMNGGSLLGFLVKQTKQDITPRDIVRMCKEAALGMEYLSSKGVVHRDLAARNLLVSDFDRNATVKVTDFGLSRKISGAYYVKSGNTSDPVLWAAPESFKPQPGKDNPFKGRVSTRSDRWSYGVVLNEAFNFGVEPYSGFSKAEIRSYMSERKPVVEYLQLKDAPIEINKLIAKCTRYDSQKRPEFKVIASRLEALEKRLAADNDKLNVWDKADDTPKEEATGLNAYDEEDPEDEDDAAHTNSAYDPEDKEGWEASGLNE